MIHKLTTITDTSTVTSEQILAWARQVEVHQSQTAFLYSLKEIKDIVAIKPGRVEQKSNPENSKNARTNKEALCKGVSCLSDPM